MRFSNRRWRVAEPLPSERLAEFPELHPVVVQLLANRGITSQSAVEAFLDPEWTTTNHDPFKFRGMQKAVDRIVEALKSKHRIAIYGDYDADGICGSAVLVHTLRQFEADWRCYIPERQKEGYGMNIAAVEQLAADGVKLIITVDCGSSNVAEVAKANELGMDVIVTDHHHEPVKVPDSFVTLNPAFKNETYPCRVLSGAGVAFKLVQALLKTTEYGATLGRTPLPEGWEKWLLDLVTVSTVADMVPLVEENRTLVRYGLLVLRKTRHLGLRALMKSARVEQATVDAEDIAYILAPRLNAAGRMSHAEQAFKLLITEDQAEAEQIAQELMRTNTERQKLTSEVYGACRIQIGDAPTTAVVFAGDPAWSAGILGLVAGKLVQHYQRPAVVYGGQRGQLVASGRSVPGVNIMESLEEVQHMLERFGGHAQACGFTLVSPDVRIDFEAAFTGAMERRITAGQGQAPMEIDAEISVDQVTWELVEAVTDLAPYGVGHPRPRFVARNAEVLAIGLVGATGQHLRLTVTGRDNVTRKMIGFSHGKHAEHLQVGDRLDMVYEVGVNTWNGNREIELKLVDVRHSHESD